MQKSRVYESAAEFAIYLNCIFFYIELQPLLWYANDIAIDNSENGLSIGSRWINRKGLSIVEKIKDFVYEITDILLAIVIALIIIFVIGLNLGGWFNFISIDNILDSPNINTSTQNNYSSEMDTQQDNSQTDLDQSVDDDDISTENLAENNSMQVSVIEVKSITIPSGTPAVGIANILLENKLIDNVPKFIEVAEKMNVSAKLKSGTFEITSTSSLEEIVKIIARQD